MTQHRTNREEDCIATKLLDTQPTYSPSICFWGLSWNGCQVAVRR